MQLKYMKMACVCTLFLSYSMFIQSMDSVQQVLKSVFWALTQYLTTQI